MRKKERERDRSWSTIINTNGPQGRSHLTRLVLWQLWNRPPCLLREKERRDSLHTWVIPTAENSCCISISLLKIHVMANSLLYKSVVTKYVAQSLNYSPQNWGRWSYNHNHVMSQHFKYTSYQRQCLDIRTRHVQAMQILRAEETTVPHCTNVGLINRKK
jgi:hypothetical protein